MPSAVPFDAILLLSFGGPEGPDDVLPFLEKVTAGRGVSQERLEIVARQYDTFDGVSPLNAQCRRIRAALEDALALAGHPLPVYWGNRNWIPFLPDVVEKMAQDGVSRALAVATSAYRSYSGCRQYRDDLDRACAEVGMSAPVIDKIRPFYDHPTFIDLFAAATEVALARLDKRDVHLVFTAHSIPESMADAFDYQAQVNQVARLVAERAAPGIPWSVAWQSRSGPPSIPWLEPDINDELRRVAASGASNVIIVPIGFVSDHMEVLFDLDVKAAATARSLGLTLERAVTPGTRPEPEFIDMLVELIRERIPAN